jgi:hypothetical protein
MPYEKYRTRRRLFVGGRHQIAHTSARATEIDNDNLYMRTARVQGGYKSSATERNTARYYYRRNVANV